MLYKFYPGGGWATRNDMTEFIDKHLLECTDSLYNMSLHGVEPFALLSESDICHFTLGQERLIPWLVSTEAPTSKQADTKGQSCVDPPKQ